LNLISNKENLRTGQVITEFFETFTFHKIEKEGTLPNSFYKATITLISNLGKDITTTKAKTIDPFL
jgi:hypothetical protein